MNNTFDEINGLFLRSQSFLLIAHQNPDGDACGSILGLLFYLKSLGKKVSVFVADKPPAYFSFLPGFEEVNSEPQVFYETWDVVVFLDSADISNTRVDMSFIRTQALVNIDHHFTNPSYGQLNFVDVRASSTCEIIYKFLKHVGFALDRRIATCLLAGIFNDTGGFSNAATNIDSIVIASDLIKHGVKIHQLFNYIANNKSIDGLRLWGVVLSRLKINKEFNIAYTYIKDEDFKLYRVSEAEFDGLANFLNVIAQVNFSMVVKIKADGTKVSLRTTRDDVDVSQIAGLFGGGGHKKAAGFSLAYKVEERDGQLVIS
ncbi:MAG: DHH family phosphoesterase [Patescibacteria group bacterium]